MQERSLFILQTFSVTSFNSLLLLNIDTPKYLPFLKMTILENNGLL